MVARLNGPLMLPGTNLQRLQEDHAVALSVSRAAFGAQELSFSWMNQAGGFMLRIQELMPIYQGIITFPGIHPVSVSQVDQFGVDFHPTL